MRQMKILIVDDKPGIRSLLRDALTDEGFLTVEVSSAEDALDSVLHKGPCDIIIADVRLPDKSGIDLFVDLSNMGVDVPVIMMTAYSTTNLAVEAIKAGAFDYIVKPFSLQETATVVRRQPFPLIHPDCLPHLLTVPSGRGRLTRAPELR